MSLRRAKRSDGSWHFFWPGVTKALEKQLDLFMQLAVVRGVHYTAVLAELISGYNEQFLRENAEQLAGVTLVRERELMDALRAAKTPVSRVLLSRYRANDRLRRGRQPLFWTDGRQVVYNLRGCKAFFRDRKGAGKGRQ